MLLKIYQVDAFTDTLFQGNPAAVCPLQNDWIDEATMQKIAAENNLAETAFYFEKDGVFPIRWFTPTTEVDFCGHATLATAAVLFEQEGFKDEEITFSTRSGPFRVRREGNGFAMNLPADSLTPFQNLDLFQDAFGITPGEAYRGKTDYLLIFDEQSRIETMPFDLRSIQKIDARGIIISAPGDEVDFVSRFFAPQSGIDEDPVTGSAHTTLTQYWSRRLNRNELSALQLSKRRGRIQCTLLEDRVELQGEAKLYMKGEIYLPG